MWSLEIANIAISRSSRETMLHDVDLQMTLVKDQAARSKMRFEQDHLMEDLHLAIAIVEHMLPMIGLSKSSRLQNNPGVMLHKRDQRAEAIEDLSRAIDSMKAAISITPDDSLKEQT